MGLCLLLPRLAEAQDVQPPSGVEVVQVAYGASSAVVVSWRNAEDYESVTVLVDGVAAPGQVDGTFQSAHVEAAPGEHTFGVQGVVGDAVSSASTTPFTVVEASPLVEPIVNLDCELVPGGGGTLRLTWELGSDVWTEGFAEIPGRNEAVTIAAGATEALLPAADEEPAVARLAFRNAAGYYSEPFTPVCLARTPAFRRGDCDGNDVVNMLDVFKQLNHQFLGAPRWFCDDACDSDDNGSIGIGDAVYSLLYLFLGGAPPPAPGPGACGVDQSEDFLGGTCGCTPGSPQ